MSEEQQPMSDLPSSDVDPSLVVDAEEGMFNVADIVVFVLFVLGLVGFYLYKKYQESNIVKIKPISLAQLKTGIVESGLDVLQRMQDSGKKMVVFYGSQTGTAEEFTTRLCKEGRYYGISAMCADPVEYDIETLSKLKEIEDHIAVFLMATYGEGEPTDNAIQLNEFMRNEETDLTGLNYAVFGLGNSTYEYYNKMGKDTDELLEKRGGTRLSPLGMGDDDGNIEDDYLNWKEAFWTDVCAKFNLTKSEDNLNIRNYKLEEHESIHSSSVFKGEMGYLGSYSSQRPPYDAKNPFMGKLTVNQNLCSEDSDRTVFHCEIDIGKAKMKYDAGDHVAIYPENNPKMVQDLAERLDVELDQVFSLDCVDEFTSKKHPFPCPTTYRTALTHYVDINTPIRTNVLRDLAQYATDENEKEFLNKLTSNTVEGKNQYNNWVVKDQRHLLQILEDCPSLQPPIDHILELMPRLQARYYSIASSPKENPKSIHVCAALVKYTTNSGRQAEGVCTSWLQKLTPSEMDEYTIPVFVRRNQGFRLPRRAAVPIIMVGPGTGLAPFRGFIQHRAALKAEGKEVGENVLFFGCRHQDKDFLYSDELYQYADEGTIQLYTAFSRDTEKKVYVQNIMEDNGYLIWELLEQGAHFYVCGDARHMAPWRTLSDIRRMFGPKQPISTRYLGHVTGYQPIRDQYFENSFRYQKDEFFRHCDDLMTPSPALRRVEREEWSGIALTGDIVYNV
eukprot:sb/3462467/